jgi:ferric-dicitrate binding protein FerR (iron transport regulator)
MTSGENELLRELEKIGEAEVRSRLARGEFGMVGSSKSTAVKAWLNSKEVERYAARESKALWNAEEAYSTARKAAAAAAEATSDSREAMTLSRLAAANSRRANVIALVALGCSILAIMAAVITAIFK